MYQTQSKYFGCFYGTSHHFGCILTQDAALPPPRQLINWRSNQLLCPVEILVRSRVWLVKRRLGPLAADP